jgi:hypothetical protein
MNEKMQTINLYIYKKSPRETGGFKSFKSAEEQGYLRHSYLNL